LSFDSTHIVLYHSLIILGELLIIIVFLDMVRKRKPPTSIISWLFFLLLFPYLTVIFYFIFGSRKQAFKYKKPPINLKKHPYHENNINAINAFFNAYGISDISRDEHFTLHDDSINAYNEFIACIREAKTSIYMSTYVFKDDDVTQRIIEELLKKAKEGVIIKILIDSLGSLPLYFFNRQVRKLRKEGIDIQFFMPIFNMPFRNYINLRNHRKIYLFDNKKVLSGGMNLSNEYFGPEMNQSRWKDILFSIEGKSSELFFEIFASDWLYARGENIYFGNHNNPSKGNTSLQVIPSGPDIHVDILYEALLYAIYNAKYRVWIVTPYFVPDYTLLKALLIAKNRGIEIHLITPKKSNHILADLTRSSYMRELEEAGAKIILHEGAMLHAKAILFDDSTVMLGSVNIDNRSLLLNYEVATFIYSTKTVNDIERWIKTLTEDASQGMKKASTPRVIMENLLRVIAPQL